MGAGEPISRRGGPPAGRTLRVAVAASVCAVGIGDIITQLALLRELLTVFAGNELVFGVILANWLLLTGVGAHLGRLVRRPRRALDILIAMEGVLGVLPVASVYALRVLRNEVFLRGQALGLTEAAVSSFVLLLPYCLSAGLLLTLACSVVSSRRTAGSIADVYVLDGLGGVLGGVLFTFVLVYLLGHFGILYLVMGLNLVCAVAVALLGRRRRLAIAAATIGVWAVSLAAHVDLAAVSLAAQYPGQQIVHHENSPYGQLVVTRVGRQYNFISSGLPLFATDTTLDAEETAHFAMAQRPRAKNVLLIGGGVSGTAREVLKYPAERVDYVELDPLIIEVARAHFPGRLDDPRLHLATTDGRLFVREAARRYDVVIVDVPDPSTLQINRLYTLEFFREVRRVLTDDGVLSFSLGQYENYIGPEMASSIASAHRTLKEVFDRVLILPPGRVFFLASDGELTAQVAERIRQAGVETRWMDAGYLDANLTADRIAQAEAVARGDAGINRDFEPRLYVHHLLHWMRQFPLRRGLVLAAVGLTVLLAIYLARIRAAAFALLTTGFAASSLEVVLLVAMQILHGVVYQEVGAIVTLFMAGLVVGSLLIHRLLPRRGRRDLVKLEFAVAGFSLLLPAVLVGLGRLGQAGGAGAQGVLSAELVLPALAFVLAVLVGMEFPLAARADFQGVAPTAGRLYLADMVGACLGALLVSTVLIPLVSVWGVCWLVAGLNILSGAVLLLTRRRAA